MDRPIFIGNVMGLETATLRQILAQLRATYCGKIGVEFMHIQDPAQKAWIQERIESIRNQTEFTAKGKLAILERLTAAEVFERFLDRKYTGTKRFGLDGGETTIPALEQILKRGSQLGVNEVVVGMAHRGRLNVLANFIGKPFSAIFSEFQGNPANPEDVQGSADVKYHLGTSADREFDGRNRPYVADRQPLPSRGGQYGGAGQGARQAEPEATIPSAARPWPCCSMAMPPSPARGWWPRPSISPSSRAIASAARCISSSTTRSASPPIRCSRAPAPIARRSPRSSRRRSSTSTATIRRRWCMSRASPPNSASSSRRTWSSTCSATGASAITRATSRPSPSR